MQVAARDGFQLAAKVFGGQPDSYMGLTAEEMAAIKQARKETEAAKKKEETVAAAGTKQMARYRPYTMPRWDSLAAPAMGQMMMPQQHMIQQPMMQQAMMQQAMAMGQQPMTPQMGAQTPPAAPAQTNMAQAAMPQMMPGTRGGMMPMGYGFRP
jgi:hypothetical protein